MILAIHPVVNTRTDFPERIQKAIHFEIPRGCSSSALTPSGYAHNLLACVTKMNESQSISSMFAHVRYMTVYPFIAKTGKHEGFDYVLTKLYNRNVAGDPYQCTGESASFPFRKVMSKVANQEK